MNIYSMRKEKKLTPTNVTIFIILLALGYAGWFFIPAWWPVSRLTGIMRGIANLAGRENDDKKLMQELLFRARETGLKLSEDNFRMKRVPFSPEEIEGLAGTHKNWKEWVQTRGKSIVIQMHYEDVAKLPLLDKPVDMVWDRTVEVEWKTGKPKKGCRCVLVQR